MAPRCTVPTIGGQGPPVTPPKCLCPRPLSNRKQGRIACQPQSLYPLSPSPHRHLYSVVVDQGGLWASSWVLFARTSRTKKKLVHLLILEGAHLQSSSRTQEHDSCRGRGETAGSGSGDSTLASPKGYFSEARSPR